MIHLIAWPRSLFASFVATGGDVLARVSSGETLVVTSGGRPIAELRPLPRRPLPATTLLERWRHLPSLDPVRLREDIDEVLDIHL